MTRTQYCTATSLDGFIATDDHSLDWLMQLGMPEDGGHAAFMREVGAMCMGAGTYEWLLRHHLKPGTPDAQPWDHAQPTWVFTSRELPRVPGADVRFVRGDVRPAHAAMVEAAGGRNVWMMGGGELAGQFHDAGLLDELILHVASVTLGSGRPLFPRAAWQRPFRLVSARRLGDAFAELRYEVIRA